VPAGAKKAYLSVISSDKAGSDTVAATPRTRPRKSRDIEKVDMGKPRKSDYVKHYLMTHASKAKRRLALANAAFNYFKVKPLFKQLTIGVFTYEAEVCIERSRRQ
jgi:hypothetical protein